MIDPSHPISFTQDTRRGPEALGVDRASVLDGLREGNLPHVSEDIFDSAQQGMPAIDIQKRMAEGTPLQVSEEIGLRGQTYQNKKFSGNLAGFNFTANRFINSVFNRCNLKNTAFVASHLCNVTFRGCSTVMASFRMCELERCNLSHTNLTDANFEKARIHENTTFRGSDLYRANFLGATFLLNDGTELTTKDLHDMYYSNKSGKKAVDKLLRKIFARCGYDGTTQMDGYLSDLMEQISFPRRNGNKRMVLGVDTKKRFEKEICSV